MYTINLKGDPNPKDKKMVKLTCIFFETGYNRASKVIDITGLFKDWDQSKQCFTPKTTEAISKNKSITDLKLQYLRVVEEWEAKKINWSPREWAHCFDDVETAKAEIKVKSVSQMIDSLIEFFSKKERFKNGKIISSFSNVREYKFLQKSLMDFTKVKYNKQFSSYFFKDINSAFLNDYAFFLQKRGAEKGNKGAVVGRLRKLRAVCNYAKEAKMSGVNMDVFKCVELKMKHDTFTPKTIPYEVFKKIEHLDMSKFSRIEQFHIDLFLFSFYAGGMANIDVAYLNWKSIKDETIEYERIKICKVAKVPLIDNAEIIINKYKNKGYDDFVFPIFTHKHKTEKQKREKLERLYYRVNKTLEKVRVEIKYKEKITWYSARGTYITKLINEGFQAEVVAKYAGNTPQVIYKHYYDVIPQSGEKKYLNNLLKK